MIRASLVPPRAIRELRDLTRRRKQLLGDTTSERNRVQKTLEDTNVKLGSILSDVFGVSGQRMLEALLEPTSKTPSSGSYANISEEQAQSHGLAAPKENLSGRRSKGSQKVQYCLLIVGGKRIELPDDNRSLGRWITIAATGQML